MSTPSASPSKLSPTMGSRTERILRSRKVLREFLESIHILDSLVDRTSVVTVDASLNVDAVLSSLLEYNHHHSSAWSPPDHRPDMQEQRQPTVGTPSLALPTNVLAEVCVFDRNKFPHPQERVVSNETVVEDLSLCRLIRPLTFSEVALYLREIRTKPELLDCSLDKWRKLQQQIPKPSEERRLSTQKNATVLLYQCEDGAARPMLCVDDKAATILRAIELLLEYPALNALPVVNPVNCTVVAHVTLANLLAYVAIHVRDEAMAGLAEIEVSAQETRGIPPSPTISPKSPKGGDKEATSSTVQTASGTAQSQTDKDNAAYPNLFFLAENRDEKVESARSKGKILVMREDIALAELLELFSSDTFLSSVPIVSAITVPKLLGQITRRGVLQYLDLCMQEHLLDAADNPREFDINSTVGEVLAVLQEHGATTSTTTKPVVSMKDILRDVLSSTRVMFTDKDGVLQRVFTCADALQALVYDD